VRGYRLCCTGQTGNLRTPTLALSSESGDGGKDMLWTLFVVLVVLWLLGLVTSYTLGGFVHILLVLAVVVLVVNLVRGRRIA
jgi:Family of unknown function (DUF5670)